MGDIFADKPVSINGIFLGMDSDHVILYQAREGRAFFKVRQLYRGDTGDLKRAFRSAAILLLDKELCRKWDDWFFDKRG